MPFKRVGVLLGGLSQEREISLLSGRAVAAGLRRGGYDVVEIDADRELHSKLEEAAVDAVFVALHGRWGEDGTVQGLLEMMGLPYTGSGVLSSAVCMDKVLARGVLAQAALPLPQGFVAETGVAALPAGWAPPVVVKPADEGSSLGVSIVREVGDLAAALERAGESSSRILVERFVEGVEVQVAVLDGEILGAVEIEPHREFYDYEAKYEEGGSTHHVPPRVADDRLAECLELGWRAYAALRCAGAARIDLIVPPSSGTVVLEVNTIPGMTENSLLPEIAAVAGISFDALVARIIESASLHVQGSA